MTASADTIDLRIQRLPHGEGLSLPAYQTAGSAGMDLAAAVAEDASLCARAGRACIGTDRSGVRGS